jgi:hypothetical protein
MSGYHGTHAAPREQVLLQKQKVIFQPDTPELHSATTNHSLHGDSSTKPQKSAVTKRIRKGVTKFEAGGETRPRHKSVTTLSAAANASVAESAAATITTSALLAAAAAQQSSETTLRSSDPADSGAWLRYSLDYSQLGHKMADLQLSECAPTVDNNILSCAAAAAKKSSTAAKATTKTTAKASGYKAVASLTAIEGRPAVTARKSGKQAGAARAKR